MIMMYKSSDFHFRIIMTDVTIHQHLPQMIYHPKMHCRWRIWEKWTRYTLGGFVYFVFPYHKFQDTWSLFYNDAYKEAVWKT